MPITEEATSFTPLKTVGTGGPVELIPEKKMKNIISLNQSEVSSFLKVLYQHIQ